MREGHVMVEGTATGKSVEIVNGQGSTVRGDGAPSTPRRWAKGEFARYEARTDIH